MCIQCHLNDFVAIDGSNLKSYISDYHLDLYYLSMWRIKITSEVCRFRNTVHHSALTHSIQIEEKVPTDVKAKPQTAAFRNVYNSVSKTRRHL